MKQYLDLLQHVLDNGEIREDRTGVGTISVFGTQTRFNLEDGFPAVTTKKLAWKSVVSELLWFMSGSTNERRLAEIQFDKPASELIGRTTIWTANADKQGVDLQYENSDTVKELGPVYGYQWRHWGSDQLLEVVNGLRSNPMSRRHVMSGWNAEDLDDMALPPCHLLYQFYVSKGKLSCQMYIRSNDLFLGAPFNIASGALLTHIIAKEVGLGVGELVYTVGDAHIYSNHVEQVKRQLKRKPKSHPTLQLPENVFDFSKTGEESILCKSADIKLIGYEHDSPISAPMAV